MAETPRDDDGSQTMARYWALSLCKNSDVAWVLCNFGPAADMLCVSVCITRPVGILLCSAVMHPPRTFGHGAGYNSGFAPTREVLRREPADLSNAWLGAL